MAFQLLVITHREPEGAPQKPGTEFAGGGQAGMGETGRVGRKKRIKNPG